MTREKALDKVIRRADRTADEYEKGHRSYDDVNAVHKMNCNIIAAAGSKGRSKKKLKK